MKGRIKKIFSLMAIASMILSLTACAGDNKKTGDSKEEKGGFAKEQVFKTYIANEPGVLDPWFNNDGAASTIIAALHETLMRPDGKEGEETQPGLLTEYKVNDTKTAHTLKLRKGAKWQDGTEITATDIVYSFQRALDRNMASEKAYQYYVISNAQEVFEGTKDSSELGIKAAGDDTVEITTTQPCDYFEEMLKSAGFAPIQKAAAEKHKDMYGSDVDKTVASGSFKLTEWKHKNSLVLEKNENYWDADNVKLEKIEITITSDTNSVIGMFQNEELSILKVSNDMIEQYKDSSGFSTNKRLKVTFIELNPKNEFLSNIKIREALSIAFDRKTFAKNIMQNEKLAAYGLVPYGVKGEAEGDFREQQGDVVSDAATDSAAIEEAKKLLDQGLMEIGKSKKEMADGFVIQCLDSGKLQAQAIQNMWKENLGIEVPVTVLDFNVLLPMLQKGTFECVIGGGQDSEYRDPQGFMQFIYNEGKWDNPAFKALVEKAHQQTGDERIAIWKEIEKMVLDNYIYIPQVYAENNWVVQDNVKGLHIYSCGYEFDYKDIYIEE